MKEQLSFIISSLIIVHPINPVNIKVCFDGHFISENQTKQSKLEYFH